jgi:hypothetical protein
MNDLGVKQLIKTKLWEGVKKKREELLNKSWIIHQDNKRDHNALVVKQFLANMCILELEPPTIHRI